MSQALYKTAGWQKRRAHQLRQEPLCRRCQARGRTVVATVADHIEPHRGDQIKFWQGALQSLCAHCHNSEKQSEERLGYSTAIGKDGWPVDDRHPANRRGGGGQISRNAQS